MGIFEIWPKLDEFGQNRARIAKSGQRLKRNNKNMINKRKVKIIEKKISFTFLFYKKRPILDNFLCSNWPKLDKFNFIQNIFCIAIKLIIENRYFFWTFLKFDQNWTNWDKIGQETG